jgi:hypothetical protein
MIKKIIGLFIFMQSLHAGDYTLRNDTKGGQSSGGTIKVTLNGTKQEKKEFTLKLESKDKWEPGLSACLDNIVVEGIDGVIKDLKTTYPIEKAQGCLSFEISIKHTDYNDKEKKPGTLTVHISNT